MSSPGSTAAGVTRARRARVRGLVLLVGLVVLAVLVLLLSRCGGGDPAATGQEGAAAPPGEVPAAAPPVADGAAPPVADGAAPPVADGAAPAAGDSAAGVAGGAGGAAGELLADGAPLLPVAGVAAAGGALTVPVGSPVTGRAVLVQSVPADEGFWVGAGATDRLWVQLTGAGESPYTVREGDRVDLTGRVVGHSAGFAEQVGAGEGAPQLTRHAAHVEVAQADLRVGAG